MGSTGTVVMVAGAFALALFVAVMLGFGGLSVSETQHSGPAGPGIPAPEPPADGSYGIVLHTSESRSGFSIFGWNVVSPKHRAHVAVVPPPGCEVEEAVSVRSEGPCTGIVAEGDISGNGRTMGGVDYVIISVAIGEACRDSLAPGDHWPPAALACER